MKRNYLKIMLGFVVAFCAVYFVQSRGGIDPYAGLRCPDDYVTSEEKTKSFERFVSIYDELHPSASLSDVMLARQDFYRTHGCVAALKRLQEYNSNTAE